MSTPTPLPTDSTFPMIICPTTHDDWDWQVTFEQYYSTGDTSGNPPTQPVRSILDSVTTLFGESGGPYDQFCFSYAEVGYLRQYLKDNPDKASVLRNAGDRFCLLGGGITSPDNQVSHCEVFIRNYLTGHDFLKSVGLIDNVFFVAWLPDDFGHDPQLPVLIEALGMKSIGISRIPGSVQPDPCSTQQAASDARTNGLSFYWPAGDGSKVLTHFMPETYYGITNGSVPLMDAQTCMDDFLGQNSQGVFWPGDIVFATQGGDWQFPNSSAPGGSNSGAYDWQGVIGATVTSGNYTAKSQLGTFADYYNLLMKSINDIPAYQLYAENYWTGYFASRPQLKIDHYQAAQLLLGAEVLGSILALYGGTTSGDQADLSEAIAQGWHLLVPTSHHDFITGTSPDSVYKVSNPPANATWDSVGQLGMSGQAVTLATDAMNLAMQQLANATAPTLPMNEIPVVVFNQIGCDLPDTALVEIDDPSGGTMDYQVLVGTTLGPVQRSSDNTLLFQVPGMGSMAYKIVYLVPQGTSNAAMSPRTVTGDYTLDNGTVSLDLSQSQGWAITQLAIGNNGYIRQNDAFANRIGIWKDCGNIYQFGMEYQSGCTTYGEYQNCDPKGGFEYSSYPQGESGTLLEAGPVRWRFLGNLLDNTSKDTYTTQYDLVRGETLVRITTAGAVTASGYSVMASFPMQTPAGETGTVLEYGTSYFWENREPERSWKGLNFRASHDFAQIVTSNEEAVAAVYHNGIPAWTIEGDTMRGCLLRNTPQSGRGASGHDTDSHTQAYTLDVNAQPASTGYPLRTALYAQTPLRAAALTPGTGATMPEAAQLASVAQTDALLRVGKTSGDGRNLILRVQQARTDAQQLDIDLPFLANQAPASPEIVTALETTPERPTTVTMSGTTASFMADRAVWTMNVPLGAEKRE